jgi:hypothetical protein
LHPVSDRRELGVSALRSGNAATDAYSTALSAAATLALAAGALGAALQ